MSNIIERVNFALDNINAPPLNKGRQQYLADVCETTDRTVRRWYASKVIPKSKLKKLASILKVNPHWLETGEGTYQKVPESILLQRNETIIPLLPWDKIKEWLLNKYEIQFTPGNYRKISLAEMNEKAFILEIVLPDLEPIIPLKSLVFIDPTAAPHHGNFVLVSKYDSTLPVIRQYLVEKDLILLESPAPGVPTTQLTQWDSIIGVVKQHLVSHSEE